VAGTTAVGTHGTKRGPDGNRPNGTLTALPVSKLTWGIRPLIKKRKKGVWFVLTPLGAWLLCRLRRFQSKVTSPAGESVFAGPVSRLKPGPSLSSGVFIS
jgi:hypothetical protein